MWERLPAELRHYILTLRMQDDRASRIQKAYLNWSLRAHRSRGDWDALREHLGKERILYLERFSGIRREWRGEGGSWLGTGENELDAICLEAEEGLWGAVTSRIEAAQSPRSVESASTISPAGGLVW